MAKKAMVLKQQKTPKFSTRAYNRCKFSEADTADTVLSQISVRSSADLASVIGSCAKLRCFLLF